MVYIGQRKLADNRYIVALRCAHCDYYERVKTDLVGTKKFCTGLTRQAGGVMLDICPCVKCKERRDGK